MEISDNSGRVLDNDLLDRLLFLNVGEEEPSAPTTFGGPPPRNTPSSAMKRKRGRPEESSSISETKQAWEMAAVSGKEFWKDLKKKAHGKKKKPTTSDSVPLDIIVDGLTKYDLQEYAKGLKTLLQQATNLTGSEQIVPRASWDIFLMTFGSDLRVACHRLGYFVAKGWFFGIVEKTEIETLMEMEEPGTFLLRLSTSNSGFAISRVNSEGKIRHHHNISFVGDSGYEIKWADNGNHTYRDMDALISSLKHKLKWAVKGSRFMQYHHELSD